MASWHGAPGLGTGSGRCPRARARAPARAGAAPPPPDLRNKAKVRTELCRVPQQLPLYRVGPLQQPVRVARPVSTRHVLRKPDWAPRDLQHFPDHRRERAQPHPQVLLPLPLHNRYLFNKVLLTMPPHSITCTLPPKVLLTLKSCVKPNPKRASRAALRQLRSSQWLRTPTHFS